MIEFGGENIGNPWHGLYRQATGKVTSDAGVVFDWPAEVDPISGDCYLISRPGMPDPTTSSAEAAAGKRWTNYTLMSGAYRVLYGKSIWPKFVYLDPDARAWSVSLSVAGDRLGQQIDISISVVRFGLVRDDAPPETPISMVLSTTFDLSDVYTGVNQTMWQADVLDIDKNGQGVLIGVPRQWGFAAVALLELSGTPGHDFAADMSLLADETTVDSFTGVEEERAPRLYIVINRQYEWGEAPIPISYTTEGAPVYPGYPGIFAAAAGGYFAFNGSQYATSATYSMSESSSEPSVIADNSALDGPVSYLYDEPYQGDRMYTFIAGARFVAGEPVICKIHDKNWYGQDSISYSVPSKTFAVGTAPLSIPGAYSETVVSGARCTVVGGQESAAQSLATVNGVGSFWAPVVNSGHGSFASAAVGTYTGVVVTDGQADSAVGYAINYSDGARIRPIFSAHRSSIWRVSNSVYAPVLYKAQGSNGGYVDPTTRFSGPFTGAVGNLDSYVSYGARCHASEHPVTGQISVDPDVVCWV